MSRAPVSLGYLQPGPARISTAQPRVTYGNDTVVVDGRADQWDYNASLRVEWPLSTDLTGVLADCGLSDDARVEAVISWHSTWTNLRGRGEVITLVDGGNSLGLEVPGHLLGGTLNLTATVTLGHPGSQPDRLAPQRPGSPLWSTRSTVVLEGAAARMPVMPVDFGTTGRGHERGLWLLECDDHDLTASVTGALLLYVNSAHPEPEELLERPHQPAATALARFMSYDITRQLVLRALHHRELDDQHSYDQGTLGDLYLKLLRTHLPTATLRQLRRQFEDDPGEIEAEVLARAWRTGT
jgi:hypothetical protein